MKVSKQTWIEIVKVIISALAGALSAVGVTTSCTVYSGSNEVSTSPTIRKSYSPVNQSKANVDSVELRLKDLEKKMKEIY